MSSTHLQLQFSADSPGMFILASVPRLSRSCIGVIAGGAAGDDHARSKVMPPCVLPGGRLRYAATGNVGSPPTPRTTRVVLLSWVPVYTTALEAKLCGR